MAQFLSQSVKYKHWLEDYTFESCKLDRGDYGRFIADYITGERQGFVLNLNGTWGSGKTEFLKRLYSELIIRNHPTIYIDAWESDFSNNPLTVISSELLSQLESCNKNIGSNAEEVISMFGKFIKGVFVGASSYASLKILDDSTIGASIAGQYVQLESKDFMNQLKNEHSEQVKAIGKIRDSLGDLAEVLHKNYSYELPIVVLVDELDRCRPNYSIEMLEVIKHFFNTSNFVFLVATDSKQLNQSIKTVYGQGFDSNTYLKRFFNRKALLPVPNLKHYLQSLNLEEKLLEFEDSLYLFPSFSKDAVDLVFHIEVAVTAFQLDIRSIDQLIAKLTSCLRAAKSSGKKPMINSLVLIAALIEFDISSESYSKRVSVRKVLSRTTSQPQLRCSIFSMKDGRDINLNSLFELMYRSIEVTYSERNPTAKRMIGFNHSEMNDMLNNQDYNNMNEVLINLSKILSDVNSQTYSSRFWIWDDYKKVIELAGSIE